MSVTKFVAATVTAVMLSGAAYAQTVGFTTLQPGSINHIKAQVIGKVVQQKSGLQVRVIPVAGSTATVAAVQNKEAEFTIGDAANMTDAVAGRNQFAKLKPMSDLRIVAKLGDFAIGFMVRKDSGLKTIADLKGKKFPIGWQAFPQGIPLSLAIFATAGMTLDDTNGINTSGLIPAANDFKAGKLDATMFALPAPKVREVDAAIGGVRWLSLPNDGAALKAVQSIRSAFTIMTVKPNPGAVGVTEPTNFLNVPSLISAGASVPEDVVYKFTKAMVENKADLVKGHPSFRGYRIDKSMTDQFAGAQYHAGAIKYYKEKGFWQGGS